MSVYAVVLRDLREKGPATKATLITRTGLDAASIDTTIAQHVADGRVVDQGAGVYSVTGVGDPGGDQTP